MMNENEFYNLTYDILNHDEFLKLRDVEHHGWTRYDHSLRVSRISYTVTKVLHLNYVEATRASLLHDFFLEDNGGLEVKDKIKLLYNHPKLASEKASSYFNLSPLEKDIIESHMFPIGFSIPKYLESWIVDIIDDGVAIYEKAYKVRKRLSFATYFIFFLISNQIK